MAGYMWKYWDVRLMLKRGLPSKFLGRGAYFLSFRPALLETLPILPSFLIYLGLDIVLSGSTLGRLGLFEGLVSAAEFLLLYFLFLKSDSGCW